MIRKIGSATCMMLLAVVPFFSSKAANWFAPDAAEVEIPNGWLDVTGGIFPGEILETEHVKRSSIIPASGCIDGQHNTQSFAYPLLIPNRVYRLKNGRVRIGKCLAWLQGDLYEADGRYYDAGTVNGNGSVPIRIMTIFSITEGDCSEENSRMIGDSEIIGPPSELSGAHWSINGQPYGDCIGPRGDQEVGRRM